MQKTREQILAECRLQSESIDVPEWGGAVVVHELAGDEMIQVGQDSENIPKEHQGTFLLTRCVRDTEGNRIFQDDDAGPLTKQPSRIIHRLCKAANRLNGLDDDAEETAKKK